MAAISSAPRFLPPPTHPCGSRSAQCPRPTSSPAQPETSNTPIPSGHVRHLTSSTTFCTFPGEAHLVAVFRLDFYSFACFPLFRDNHDWNVNTSTIRARRWELVGSRAPRARLPPAIRRRQVISHRPKHRRLCSRERPPSRGLRHRRLACPPLRATLLPAPETRLGEQDIDERVGADGPATGGGGGWRKGCFSGHHLGTSRYRTIRTVESVTLTRSGQWWWSKRRQRHGHLGAVGACAMGEELHPSGGCRRAPLGHHPVHLPAHARGNPLHYAEPCRATLAVHVCARPTLLHSHQPSEQHQDLLAHGARA